MDIVTYALCKKKDNEIIDMIESMEKLTVTISDTVPTVDTAEPNKLYLVDTNHDGIYEEYILAEISGVEQIVELGQVIDLTNYYTKTETDNAIKGYHQVISDTTYSNLPDATKKNGNVYYVYTETSPLDDDGVYITNSAGNRVFVKPNGNIYKNGLLYSDTNFTAEKIKYLNVFSSLQSSNVQDAIDELKSLVDSGVGKAEIGEIFNTYTGQYKNSATAEGSHAEGSSTTASGIYSHAEGAGTTAQGVASHAEGGSMAIGDRSHAEGMTTRSYGAYSHAEGITTIARGSASHAGGNSTIANTANSTAIGKFNVADGTEVSDPKHLFIIGNGTADNARSNIVEVSETDMNVNGDITRNSVPMYPLVYNPQTESFSFAGLT